MSGFLLDTNVISELRKPRCHPAVKRWSDSQTGEDLFVSVVVMAEVRYGIEQANDAAFRKELVAWLDGTLRPWFAGRILPITEEVIVRWRTMVERGRKQAHTFSQPDLFIAATADLNGLTVVTRNVGDFTTAGVQVLNPWEYDAQSQ